MDRARELLSMNMKTARKRLGYSQQKLAEICEVSTSYIGELEIGRKFPSSKMLVRIAAALQIKPYRLFYDPAEEDTPLGELVVAEFRRELMDTIRNDIDRVLGSSVKEKRDE
jgi:transcriptional regulator with XRE-family HTH domain